MIKQITCSELEEMIYFALRESIEFAKASKEDYSITVEKKLQDEKGYNLTPMLASRVQRPVFWYLSSEHNYILYNEKDSWSIAENAKNLTAKDLKEMAKSIFNESRVYLESNFRENKYEVIAQ
jgi:hypothetical protein